MRSLGVLLVLVVLGACGGEPPPDQAAAPPPVETLQDVADALGCRGPEQGEAGYVGIRCEGSAAELTIAEWSDMPRADVERINGAIVGDPDLWFMATDSITVSATDPAVIDEARAALD